MSSIVRKSYEVFNFQNLVNLMVSMLVSYDESAVMSAIGQKEPLSSDLNRLISAQASQIKAFWSKTHVRFEVFANYE